MDATTIPAELVANYGALTVFFAFGIALLGYYVFRVEPENRKYNRELNSTIMEQVALSRQALETSNEVIRMNNDEMRENRLSHQRIGERLECVEDAVKVHDTRAIDIAKDVAVIKAKCEEAHP